MTNIFAWFDSVSKITGGIIGVAAVVALAWKPVKKAMSARRGRTARIQAYRERNDQMYAMVGAMADDMKKVRAELQENGGHSLKDLVYTVRAGLGLEIATRRMLDERAVWQRRIVKGGVMQTIHVSPEWTRITGLARDAMDSGGWSRCISPRDRVRALASWNLAMEDTVFFQEQYLAISVLTGTNTTVCHEDTPVFDSNGDLIGWVGVLTEVEPQHRRATDINEHKVTT